LQNDHLAGDSFSGNDCLCGEKMSDSSFARVAGKQPESLPISVASLTSSLAEAVSPTVLKRKALNRHGEQEDFHQPEIVTPSVKPMDVINACDCASINQKLYQPKAGEE
jgi:hypothetical protein